MTAKQEKVFSAVLLATAFTALFLARLFMLNQSLEPNGLDGYYYALQAKSMMETGRLENPSLQPGYYLCGLGGILTGDAIQGVKLWAALSAALTSSLHTWVGWSDNLIKIPVDILLFFLSYTLQQRWVFKG